ncbi:uncharacterized protein N7484_006091 [Penicillium longicatenatum]|uniref:uncharacterized protein n=1 Tax=Penicillium longicatenatum TaxID=1561947 RepID=UPI002547BED1|nr:uncharacterized protein N7484_006091 [Penicillium longicatenatum]KAJ5643584.1 hypothetical protein N7484_006091 [Penicillium longicatenatum]
MKAGIRKRKDDESKAQSSTMKEMNKINKEISVIQASMETEVDDQRLSDLKARMTELITSRSGIEERLKQHEANIQGADDEIRQIDQPEGMEIESDDFYAQSASAIESPSKSDEVPEGAVPVESVTAVAEENQDVAITGERNDAGERDETHQSTNNNNNSEISTLESREGNNTPSVLDSVESTVAAQTSELSKENSQSQTDSRNERTLQPQHIPRTYDDYNSVAMDAQINNETDGISLENGTVLVQTRQGSLSMNSYGWRNSPMYIWSQQPASRRADHVPFLSEAPHCDAMKKEKDVLIYKGKVGASSMGA